MTIEATTKFLYPYKFDYHHSELCKLETRQIFGEEVKDKLVFSDREVDPSISPFMKGRFEIILCSDSYNSLLKSIQNKDIQTHGFKVEYVILDGDANDFKERKSKLRGVGYSIFAAPDFDNPSITYAICTHKGAWYFGMFTEANNDWYKHKNKPQSFSNSIDQKIGKTLVGLASKGNTDMRLLDACCGVGTVMLEACSSGFSIDGCDIHPKACVHARANLAHYDYKSKVYYSDIKDLDQNYDAAIIDLPYNLYSYSNETITSHIISSAVKLAARIVIVSISDIEPIIKTARLVISDFCTVEKRGGSQFKRNVWVCERVG
ncbi:MAG: TRM11 family methyltransferase [Flavobacteriales bacterium]